MDHFELLDATLRGAATPRPPVSLWRHWPVADQTPRGLAGAMVAWQAAYDFDLLKFMPSGTYGVEDWGVRTVYEPTVWGNRTIAEYAIVRAGDWRRLRPLDASAGVLGMQHEALRLAAQALDGSVPILQTVFSPLTTALKLAGDALWSHLAQDPEAVLEGLEAITQTTIAFSRMALEAGAHGLFFANQSANLELLCDADFERFTARFDTRVLDAVSPLARYVMVHLHGNDVRFESVARRYACNMISWHDRHTRPSLAEARGLTDKLLVGGLEWSESMARCAPAHLQSLIDDAWRQSGGRGWMLAPGCVCPVSITDAQVRCVIQHLRQDAAALAVSWPDGGAVLPRRTSSTAYS